MLSWRLDSNVLGLGSHYFFPFSLLPPRDKCQALGLGPPDLDRFSNSLRRRLPFGRMAALKNFPHCVSQDLCFFLSHFDLPIYFWPGCVFFGASGLCLFVRSRLHIAEAPLAGEHRLRVSLASLVSAFWLRSCSLLAVERGLKKCCTRA